MIEVSWQMPDSGTKVLRHCVLSDCAWTYLEPPCRPMVARSLEADAITEAIQRAVNAHHAEVEAVLLEHARSHDVVEYVRAVVEMRQALGTADPRHPLLISTCPAEINDGRIVRL